MGRGGNSCCRRIISCILEFNPVNERVASLHLRVGVWILTIVCAYSPNSILVYPSFLESLEGALVSAPFEGSLALLGDFNAAATVRPGGA